MLLSEITGGIAFFESVLNSVMKDEIVEYDDDDESEDLFDGGDESDVFEFGGHEDGDEEEIPDEVFSVNEESDGEIFEESESGAASIDDIADLLRKMIKNYVSKHQ